MRALPIALFLMTFTCLAGAYVDYATGSDILFAGFFWNIASPGSISAKCGCSETMALLTNLEYFAVYILGVIDWMSGAWSDI